MSIEKTHAIVLRVTPYSATSHIVTWLTPHRGRMATMVKGACRPKSVFLGQYDLHYTCELLFYTRDRGGMPIAKECTPLKTRTPLRSDWQAALCAGYTSELTTLGTMPGQQVPGLYDLLDQFLDFLADNGTLRTLLPWFELSLLSTLGFSPRLDSCCICGVHVAPAPYAALAGRHGGIVCGNCRNRPDTGLVRSVSGSVLAMLAAWQRGSSPRSAYTTVCQDKPWLETLDILGTLLSEHLGETPALRNRVARLLEGRIPSRNNREES